MECREEECDDEEQNKEKPENGKNYTTAALKKAMRKVWYRQMGLREAARHYNIPPSTLQQKLKRLQERESRKQIDELELGERREENLEAKSKHAKNRRLCSNQQSPEVRSDNEQTHSEPEEPPGDEEEQEVVQERQEAKEGKLPWPLPIEDGLVVRLEVMPENLKAILDIKSPSGGKGSARCKGKTAKCNSNRGGSSKVTAVLPKQKKASQKKVGMDPSENKSGECKISNKSKNNHSGKGTVEDGQTKTKVKESRAKWQPSESQGDSELTLEEEERMVALVLDFKCQGFPMKMDILLDAVQNMLNENSNRRTSFPNNRPTKEWYQSFVRRHPEVNTPIPTARQQSREQERKRKAIETDKHAVPKSKKCKSRHKGSLGKSCQRGECSESEIPCECEDLGQSQSEVDEMIDTNICSKCEEDYDDEPHNWIGCSSCERWFHRSCIQIDVSGYTDSEIEALDFICEFCDASGVT